MTNIIYSWSDAVSDSYQLLEEENENVDDWSICPNCLEYPRLWIFNNGKYAKCRCQGLYDKAQAVGQSINEYYQINKTLENYSNKDLMENWNKRCMYIKILNI